MVAVLKTEGRHGSSGKSKLGRITVRVYLRW